MTTTLARPKAPKFTPEQSAALDARNISVALSAGAGCGKTFVLTQRFLALFDPQSPGAIQPEDIGSAVAITFTNAAAREMRDRVRRACYDRLKSAIGAADVTYWSKMVRSLDSARITTIDAFCNTLLRSHAVEAAIDPQFTVLEPAQGDSMLREYTEAVLRERLAEQDGAALELAVLFDLPGLAERLKRLAGHRDAAQFGVWSAASPQQLVERWTKLHREQVVPSVMRRLVESEPALALGELLAHATPLDPVVVEQRTAILAIFAAWRDGKCLGADPLSDLQSLRQNAKIQKRSPKSWSDPADYDRFRDLSKELRERVIDRFASRLGFDPRQATSAAEIGLQMLVLAGVIHERYHQAKRAAGELDIRDLLVRSSELLTDPAHGALRERVAGQIRLLLVDEFQDTDPLQVELIAALCGDGLQTGKLFFVGDYKQSIYRFRGADPTVFSNLRKRMPAAGQLPLTLNFRSQPAVLNFVNALFAGKLGQEFEALQASRPQTTAEPAIEFLWALPAEPPAGKESADTLRRREAEWIARRLRGLIDRQEPLIGAEAETKGDAQPDSKSDAQPHAFSGAQQHPAVRPARYGDIAILFRALSDVSHYEDALRRYGLPYYLVGGHAFYAQQEIFDLTNVLRAVHEPADLVSLAGALRSPFFSLADETLFWLAGHPRGLGAGLLAKTLPRELTAEQRRGVAFAADTLRSLRAAKDRVSIAELIQMALAATGYDALLLAEFLGERKLANLRKLIDLARDFERDGQMNLADFIAELAGQVSEQPKEALAATHGADMNVVRLMSIHQSKGLEFPIVVVADVDRAAQSRPPGVEFHADWGPLVKLPDDSDDAPAAGYELFHLLASEEDEAEIRRLFYVATTRAADYLILSAGITSLDRMQGPWLKLLESRFDLTSGKFTGTGDGAGAIAAAAVGADDAATSAARMPRVKVVSEQPECGAGESSGRSAAWSDLLETAHRQAAASPTSELRMIAPLPVAIAERRQFSFSRLSGAVHARPRQAIVADADWELDDPAAIDPLGLGTLVHAVIADLRFPCSPPALQSLVRRHAERHMDPDSEDARTATSLVERFLRSPRAAELAAAKVDHVETEFLLAWPNGIAVNKTTASQTTASQATANPTRAIREIQLLGFIDRLYQSADGEWTLLDFKTNRVAPGAIDSVAAEYELQMLVYAAAAERVLGKPPRSLVLHFLRSGEERRFAWNDTARTRLAELLDAAIDKTAP